MSSQYTKFYDLRRIYNLARVLGHLNSERVKNHILLTKVDNSRAESGLSAMTTNLTVLNISSNNTYL